MLTLLVLLSVFTLLTAYPHPSSQNRAPIGVRTLPAFTVKYPILSEGWARFFHSNPATSGTTCNQGRCIISFTAKEDEFVCDADNGTEFSRGRDPQPYTLICDMDFPGQDIYPFLWATSFEQCLSMCLDLNKKIVGTKCMGFVFAPDRMTGTDNCYLKSSLAFPMKAAIRLIGAILGPSPAVNVVAQPSKAGTHVLPITLRVKSVHVLGSSRNEPTTQYVSHKPYSEPQEYGEGPIHEANEKIVSTYPIAEGTGTWTEETKPATFALSSMKVVPHLCRDGGRGGTINGTHVFVFTDTQSFATGSDQMNSFVSSSVATDQGMKALLGEPLVLVDNVGEWQDDVGRMRGFIPMTSGEEAYNKHLSGSGYRYTVWPESSLIPLNTTHALLYPALIYDVHLSRQDPVFHEIGNSVALVSVDPTFGPNADRVVKQLYRQDEMTFGTLGGFRAWGSEGIGGNDGDIYLFGQKRGENGDGSGGGVRVAKTTPQGFTDLSTYCYWNGKSWTKTMAQSDSQGHMLDFPVQDLDVLFVPALGSFVMVYLNSYGDNTFYYRHLPLDLNATQADGYGEHIVTGTWSEEKVLVKVDKPAEGFIYAGGIHAGYFGNDDITTGGWSMLITWTEKTGKPAESPESGYSHQSAVVKLGIS